MFRDALELFYMVACLNLRKVYVVTSQGQLRIVWSVIMVMSAAVVYRVGQYDYTDRAR